MFRVFKYRLYPNKDQQRELLVSLETHRRIYNAALAERTEAWDKEKRVLHWEQQYEAFVVRRNVQREAEQNGEDGPFFLAHIAAVSMRDTVKRVDKALQNFFRRCRTGEKPGYPRLRSKDCYDSVPFDNYDSGCSLRNQKGRLVRGDMADDAELRGHSLRLFGVGKKIRMVLHRPVKGKIKTVTVKREGGHWYVSFACDLGPVTAAPSANPPVGVDVGITNFVTTSDGEHYPNPRPLEASLAELRRLNRKIALNERKKVKKRDYPKRGSRRREENKDRLRKVYRKVKNARKDNHHKVAKDLIGRYGTVCVERLNIEAMVKNDKLASRIKDASWGGFVMVLRCKAESAGVRIVDVSARYTSQACSACGHTEAKNRSRQAFVCLKCGHAENADVNAAKNILARGLVGAPPARAQRAAARATKRVAFAQGLLFPLAT